MNKMNKLSFKLQTFSYLNSNQPENIYIGQYNPIPKLLQDYEEIETILILFKRKNLTKILYINYETIEKFLNESDDNIIEINSKDIGNDLNYLFYLSLLITYSYIINNYSYKFDLIEQINLQYEKEQNIYKKIIISKIILDLINYYEESADENYESSTIQTIQTKIEEEIKILEKFKLNWNLEIFRKKKIDEIYIDLIISIIKSNDSYEDSVNTLKELDLENINITKIMKEGIFKLLENDNFTNKYKIETIEDIFDEKKLQFFSI